MAHCPCTPMQTSLLSPRTFLPFPSFFIAFHPCPPPSLSPSILFVRVCMCVCVCVRHVPGWRRPSPRGCRSPTACASAPSTGTQADRECSLAPIPLPLTHTHMVDHTTHVSWAIPHTLAPIHTHRHKFFSHTVIPTRELTHGWTHAHTHKL